MNYKSQIGYIMDLLEITGKDLANAINVDRTLVSKWKNNARKIKPNNAHFHNILDALIFFNSCRKDSILERFFGKVYPNEDKNEPDYLEVCLHLWLDGKELGNFDNLNDWRTSKTALYATNVEVYKGNAGKRHALIDFFQYALTMPAGQEIFISDVESQEWLLEDLEFQKTYNRLLKQLVDKGHNLTIIHDMQHCDAMSRALELKRFEIYYSGNITSYYSIDFKDKINASLYIIHRHMSMVSMMPDDSHENRYIAINRDPFTIQHFVRIFVTRLKHAHPMVSTFSAQGGKLKGFLEELLTDLKPSNIYYTAPQIPLPLYDRDILHDILEINGVPGQKRNFVDQVKVKNEQLMFQFKNSHDIEILISQDQLEINLAEESIKLCELSAICNQDIYVTPDKYREILKAAYDLEKGWSYLNISVLPFNELKILDHVVFWMFEDQHMYSIEVDNGQTFVISSAKIILEFLLNHIQNLLMEYEHMEKLDHYCREYS